MKTKNLKKTITRWVLRIVLFFFLSSLAATIIYSFIRVPITPLMIIRLTEGLFSGDPVGIHKKWTPIQEISPNMVRAVVASEDQLFLEHNGFDFNAIDKARKHNEHSRRKRGASTISQQTAKNVFLWPARTWFRKGLEVYFTVLIEIFWSKERIMEVYLNVAEMGNGYYGVGAAAPHFFNKKPSQLTKAEAAAIAACLPDPRRRNPAKPSPYVAGRRNAILRHMNQINPIDFSK